MGLVLFHSALAMPMLFLVAGLGARYSIDRRGQGGFARERLPRLGVPLVFAALPIIPVPQWLRLRAAESRQLGDPAAVRVRGAPDYGHALPVRAARRPAVGAPVLICFAVPV
ncbi:hypothetical protein ABZ464_45375 [Streptomyces sp. NPDC005820]|uniref:hypothetical protein n=1 Tax=Streptomyces sp. NPDC005820 TaxID=3157069 RepID=UPI0033F010DE